MLTPSGSLYSSWSTRPHPHSPFISPYWSSFTCLILPCLLPPCPPFPLVLFAIGMNLLHWSVIATAVNILSAWCLTFLLTLVSGNVQCHFLLVYVYLSLLHAIVLSSLSNIPPIPCIEQCYSLECLDYLILQKIKTFIIGNSCYCMLINIQGWFLAPIHRVSKIPFLLVPTHLLTEDE